MLQNSWTLYILKTQLEIDVFKLGFSSRWTENFHMNKLDLEKAEESGIKLPTYAAS